MYSKKETRRIEKLRKEFLPEAVELVEKPVSPLGKTVIFVILILMIFVILWSVFGRMDEVITARGRINSVSGIQNIQTVNGGIIKEVCVEEGDEVKKGQPIIYLDTTEQQLTQNNTKDSLKLLKFENKLLKEILNDSDISVKYKNVDNENQQEIIKYVSAIQGGYIAQIDMIEEQMSQAEVQVQINEKKLERIKEELGYVAKEQETEKQLETQKTVAELEKEKLELQLQYYEDEISEYERLYAIGAVTKEELKKRQLEIALLKKELEMQDSNKEQNDINNQMQKNSTDQKYADISGEYQEQQLVVEQARREYSAYQEQKNSIREQYEETISSLMKENTQAMSNLTMNYNLQNVNMNQQIVVAPVDGVINTIETSTLFGVLGGGEIVATLLPQGEQTVVEAEITNQDIGSVSIGNEVAIKLDSYNFQDYGKLKGTLVYISPDAQFVEGKGWMYQARISIDTEAFLSKNPEVNLKSGIEGTLEIKVDERRIIQIFLEPIVEHFDGSMKIK